MHEDTASRESMDWRILLGLTVTLIWIGAGLIYLSVIVGWEHFLALPTADLGSFFEGAFAPLAFLWLVIGHFVQQKEISANTRAISMQERSTRRLELHSRRDSYFKLLTLVQDQLGNIAAFHYVSVFGPTGSQEISQEEFSRLRSDASTGDHSLFIRRMVTALVKQADNFDVTNDILYGTPIRQRHSDNFMRTFQRLIAAAESVDTDNMVKDALLQGSAAGIYYQILRHYSGEETSENPIANQQLHSSAVSQPLR
ncbi:MAG: hypothetical protein AB8B57_01110 [Congregibacter sp.]